MSTKIGAIVEAVRNRHKERDAAVSAVFLSMISGKDIVFIGPEGTGKERIVDDVFGDVPRYTVSPSTTREETESIGGDVILLDDVFKANSGTLNGIMDGMASGKRIICGASCGVPSEDDEAYSLYGRFLLRAFVGPMCSDEAFLSFVSDKAKEDIKTVARDETDAVRKAAGTVPVDDDVLSAILSLRDSFKNAGKYTSDERWKGALHVMKAAAAAAGSETVGISYIPLLQHILWDRHEEMDEIRAMVFAVCTPGGLELNGLHAEADELLRLAVGSKGSVDETAGFPRTIHCYDCNASFPTLKRLKEHSVSRPRHTYADPHIAKDSGSQDYVKYTYEELVTLMSSKYGWDIFKKSDGAEKEGFLREAKALRDRKKRLEDSCDKDRAKLEKELERNFWLTGQDRKDMMTVFNLRSAKLAEIEGSIADVEFILE